MFNDLVITSNVLACVEADSDKVYNCSVDETKKNDNCNCNNCSSNKSISCSISCNHSTCSGHQNRTLSQQKRAHRSMYPFSVFSPGGGGRFVNRTYENSLNNKIKIFNISNNKCLNSKK